MSPSLASVPVPRFAIGETVYSGSAERALVELECPDCLGTKQARLVMPSGDEFDAVCPRCDPYGAARDLPRLVKVDYKPQVRRLTVGSVRIDTASDRGEAVTYMCEETGVGSGTIHYESRLRASEGRAAHDAEVACQVGRLNEAGKPEAVRVTGLLRARLTEAILEAARKQTWDAWWSYRALAEDIGDLVDKKNGATHAALESALSMDRYRDPSPLESLVREVDRLLVGMVAGDALLGGLFAARQKLLPAVPAEAAEVAP